MIALGIDPGAKNIGWCVCSVRGMEIRIQDLGVISGISDQTLNVADQDLDRISTIKSQLKSILQRFKIDFAVIEIPPFHMPQAKILRLMSLNTGAIFSDLVEREIEVFQISPIELKKLVCKNGKARKPEVHDSVRNHVPELDLYLERLEKPQRQHPVDAIGAIIALVIKGASENQT